MSNLSNVVTPDDLMEEFIMDYTVADDELSDSIFTCVDNTIDDLCLAVMDSEDSILEDDSDAGVPFTYILDKVIEKVDTLESIQDESSAKILEKQLGLNGYGDEFSNRFDPDYCEDVDFSEITPEDFQLFVSGRRVNEEETYDDGYDEYSEDSGLFSDSNFNA